MSAATRIPLPVAESQLATKTALSALGCDTTGGIRNTRLSSPAIANDGLEIPSSSALTCGNPQRNTTTLRMSHGVHARSSWRLSPAALGSRGTSAGCQTRNNRVTAPNDTTAAPTSTSHGP